MKLEFSKAVAADLRRHQVWSGDLQALGATPPPVTSFEEPIVEIREGVHVVSVPRLLTASGWRRVTELVDAAGADGSPVMLKISTVATQVAGAAKCCEKVRALRARSKIFGHVESTACGGGLVLLQTCEKRYASPGAMLGLGSEGKPFVHPESN